MPNKERETLKELVYADIETQFEIQFENPNDEANDHYYPEHQEFDHREIDAGFKQGDSLSHNPPCPNCSLCNAMLKRLYENRFRYKCRGCGYVCEESDDSSVRELKSLHNVIQICPRCSRLDQYKNDGHLCIPKEEFYD